MKGDDNMSPDLMLDQSLSISSNAQTSSALSISSLYTFDTIQDMLNSTSLKEGDIVTVLGYYDKTDGASHKRIISSTQDSSSLTYGQYYANILYEDELYSTWFGCKQDGETDDTKAFQNFLNYFGKARLIVPGGIIKTSEMLVLKGIFRNQGTNVGNVSFREIYFRGAAIKYTGTENGCSVFICFHFNSIIDGLAIHDKSSANFINFCATWNSNFRNFHVSNLYINENNTAVDKLHSDGEIYYQFNMSFTRGDITKKLKITSTSQDTTNRTWLINSMFFDHIIMGAENTDDSSYCIELYGGAGLENVNFINCDLSYATKALFYIDTPFSNGTINIKQCYLDSALPLVEDFNYQSIIFNLADNYEASNDGKQIMGLKLTNMMQSSHTGCKGVEANYLPSTMMNLCMNGNLELTSRNSKWLIDDGAMNGLMTDSSNSLYGNALSCLFNRNEKHNGLHFLTMPLPTTGTYTCGIRLKKISGSGTLQLILDNRYFKNFDLSHLADGEEALLSTYGNGKTTFNENTTAKILLYAFGTDTNLSIEIYEMIFVAGTYISWNLPIHPKARLVTNSTSLEDLSNYYTKSEVDTKLSNTSSSSSPTDLTNYYTKSEVDTKLSSISSSSPTDLTSYYTKSEVNTLLSTSSPSSTSSDSDYIYEDIFFYKKSELQYVKSMVPTLPDINTKHIVCMRQTLPLYDMLSDFVVSLLTSQPALLTHTNKSNQISNLPELKIQSRALTYYFTIRVDDVSETAPTLQLYNHNSTNTAVSFSGLKATKGIQKIKCAVGGTFVYTSDSILKPQIGITDEDIENGRYITYQILGVYDKDLLSAEENFIGDVKFAGERFDGSPDGITMTLNGTEYTLPVLRGIYGFSDYIRNGKVYRRIVKKLITADMIDTLTNPWSTIYKMGTKSSMVMLNLELTDFKQSADPWYTNNGLRWYVWSPTITTHSFSSTSNFGGDANIRAIYYGPAHGYTGTRIILKLTHEDIGYDYEKDPKPTTEELVSMYKTWVTNHPTYIYYPVENPIEEELGFELPMLLGNLTDNTLSFDTGSSLSIAPWLRVKHPSSNYPRLSGKTWLMIGDSITESMGSTFNYPTLAANLIPDCKVYNYGKSGSSICQYNNGARAWAVYLENNIKSLPDYVDLITINLGINDRKDSMTIGNLMDAPNSQGSLHAAFKSILLTLTNKYPLARIVILAPVRLSAFLTSDMQLYQIIQAEKEEAEFFNLQFINLQTGGGVNNFYPTNNNAWDVTDLNKRTGWLSADGGHYNDIAHRMLFEAIVQQL